MNKLSLETGRKSQKKKTRQNILNSAQELLATNKPISLEEVAKHSNTSRATVYRYFSNIDILCSEASIDLHTKTPEELVESCKHLSIVEQLLYIQDYFNQLSIDNEVAFRKYLSTYLKEDFSKGQQPARGGRRTRAIKLVLKPLKNKLEKRTFNSLVASITTFIGIEPLIICKDVSGLNSKMAKESLSWGLKTLLDGCELARLKG